MDKLVYLGLDVRTRGDICTHNYGVPLAFLTKPRRSSISDRLDNRKVGVLS